VDQDRGRAGPVKPRDAGSLDSGSAPLGALLRISRQTAGLTQQQLASLSGVGIGTVRDVEQGRTRHARWTSVSRLATALGLDSVGTDNFARAARELGHGEWQQGSRWARSGGLRIQVLGPLEVWRDGRPVALSAVKPRVVLAILAVQANVSVRRDELVDAVWGENPPATAPSLVQAYVSGLRHVLDPGRSPRDPSGRLVLTGGCYLLRVTGGELDMLAFRQLADLAWAAACAGDLTGACDLYEQALRMWPAEPLADIEIPDSHPAVISLGRQRATVIASYAEAAFGAGLPGRVLGRLQALADREPMNEVAHAQLMIALAGSGRQAEALRVYDDIRHRLDEELGVLPGSDLARAYQRVLGQDIPAAVTGIAGGPVLLRGTDAERPVRPGATVVPRLLPAPPAHFTGRARELAMLNGLMRRARRAGGAVVISAIGGTAGVGKTALAVRWAHQVAGRFPDGQLYVNLRGFDPSGTPVTPAEAIRRFLDALLVSADWIPSSPQAREDLYRSMVAGRRLLIVLDNARDSEQVRPLLPGGPGSLVVVTSRSQLTGLAAAEGARQIFLGVLSCDEAHELLAARLGHSGSSRSRRRSAS
jgi:DNA-binding SARP family transcriptional activator